MKILFIYPNDDSQVGFNYGIAHISAVCRKAGHSVELWHFCSSVKKLPSKKQFTDKLIKSSFDIIGFSVVTNQWPLAQKFARWIKSVSSVPIVCGGIHALAAGKEILNTKLFDYIIIGEAEDSFLEFVNKKAKGKDVGNIKNLGMIKNGRYILNPVRPFPDLAKLPMKDYEIFDFQRIIDEKNGWVGLMASRGCPFSCTYCFNHHMVSHYRKDLSCNFNQLNYIRHFSIKQLISEINYLTSKYKNIKMFIFDDDLFTFYGKYVKDFCMAYKKKFSLPFVVNAHVGFFDEKRARYLADANCKIVKFGVESGSERVRKMFLNRHMKNEKIIKAIQLAEKTKLHSSVFIMIGLPGETCEDVMETLKLLGKAKPGRFRWSFFFPFPGTKAYDLTMQKHQVVQNEMVSMTNFTEKSCIDFGKKQNLFLKKVGKIMPWFVNAYSELEVSDFYKQKIDQILSLDSDDWEKREKNILEEDKKYSDDFVDNRLSHYAVKYNPFMGVISDYFVNEK